MLNLDSDSNLWVAGLGYVTKVFTDSSQISAASPARGITATLGGSPIQITLSTSAVQAPISLHLSADATLASACSQNPSDSCCTAGNFDSGIAITRKVAAPGASTSSNQNTIYVASTCETGMVRAHNNNMVVT